MALRPYQTKAIDLIRTRINEKPLLVLSTGSGKTVIFTEIIRRFVARGKRATVLVHRDELVRQAAAKLTDLSPGIVKAGYRPTQSAVQVASVQTLVRRDPHPTDMVIIDEAHHATSTSYQTVLGYWPDAYRWGCTATPYRLDGKGLGSTFGCIVEPATMGELIRDGYLIRPTIYSHPIDLKGVHTQAGDYNAGELADRVNKPKLIGNVVEEWLRLAGGVPTICFAVNIAHSKAIVDAFVAAGVRAEHLDGSTPSDERRAALERLATGTTRVVSNCSLFGEGVDIPVLGCAILARPTKSMALYRQQVGRVMRPADGKTTALVLDHGGCAIEHGLPWDELEYSLEERVRKIRAAPISRCPQCFMVIDPPRSVCPNCGFERAAPVEVPRHAAGTLEEIQSRPARELSPGEQRLAACLVRHLTTCKDKNYNEKWALMQFKLERKFWPKTNIIEAARASIAAGVRIRSAPGVPEPV